MRFVFSGWDDLWRGADVRLPETGAADHLAGEQGDAEGGDCQGQHTQGLGEYFLLMIIIIMLHLEQHKYIDICMLTPIANRRAKRKSHKKCYAA